MAKVVGQLSGIVDAMVRRHKLGLAQAILLEKQEQLFIAHGLTTADIRRLTELLNDAFGEG